tara:strand:+ start:223 stop:474 length:252 start_codon:yes stop_codon:yes gene_type:complete
MVNGKSPIKSPIKSLRKSPIKSLRKSPRTKNINNKKRKTSQILNAIEELRQLELRLKAELVHVKKQQRMLYNSLLKIPSPRKL